jgi:tetrahydromethanopterin S-methyltransferase subunit G
VRRRGKIERRMCGTDEEMMKIVSEERGGMMKNKWERRDKMKLSQINRKLEFVWNIIVQRIFEDLN